MPYFHMPKKPWVSDSPKEQGNKTIQAKKHTLIVDASDRSPKRTVETAAGTIQFEDGTAILPDDARGQDITQEYLAKTGSKSVAVRDQRVSKWRDPVHRNFWGSHPEMPWRRQDADGENGQTEN